MRQKITFLFIFVILVTTPFLIRGADLNHDKYPKLANLFFRWDITASEAKELANWDILIIDMDVQTYSPESLKLLKKYNPDIKLLAYIASQEIRGDSASLNGTLRQKLYNQINSSWWLKDSSGNKVAWWAPNPMFNITTEAPTVNGKKAYDIIPQFVKNELMDSGYWDGVFYDNVWDNISFMADFNIDLDQNGTPDSMNDINIKWKQGMDILLSNTRQLLGKEALIAGNGGETFYKYMNGVMYEHFPYNGWSETLTKYKFMNNNGYQPSLSILNSNVKNSNDQGNYQKMRYGLASALLHDGYYSFDNGDQSHREIWWYDEYEAYLGRPAGDAFNIASGSNSFGNGVWRRDFKNGLVIVNSTSEDQYIELGGEYEKLHGEQDPLTNDGLFVEGVEVSKNDGLILLRPIEQILQATYVNGSFARVFNEFGHVSRGGFFAYNENYTGSSQVVVHDLDGDGLNETLVAGSKKVDIYNNNGTLRKSFYPYTENYDRGINITVGDLDNNGTLEIVTGTEKGGGPHVRIFNSNGDLINPGFFAYGPEFRGGVNVTIADLDGDGWYEIVAGAGFGGGPHVRVFAPDGRCINPGFFAYDPAFRGGVNVAAGDVNGDGIDEIITGPGKGGGPQVKIFDKNGKQVSTSFFAFDEADRNGVKVVASDMDGDGKVEIIATTTNVFTLSSLNK